MKVTVSVKNVNQQSDKLVHALTHKAGEETCIVHMSSSFLLHIADKGFIKEPPCKCMKTFQE